MRKRPPPQASSSREEVSPAPRSQMRISMFWRSINLIKTTFVYKGKFPSGIRVFDRYNRQSNFWELPLFVEVSTKIQATDCRHHIKNTDYYSSSGIKSEAYFLFVIRFWRWNGFLKIDCPANRISFLPSFGEITKRIFFAL